MGKCKNCAAKKIFALDSYERDEKLCGENGIGIAIDIGTTTLVFELLNLRDGERIAAYSCANSQRAFGADVLTRISAATDGAAAILHACVMDDLKRGIENLLSRGGVGENDISGAAIVGNTTMLHLLQNLPCETLGRYPFTPVSVSASQIEIAGIHAEILPCVSAFIGADTVAAILHCNPTAGYNLLIDLGTNAEIALFGERGEIFVTSAAAGPAFEGGNFCGSQAIDMYADFLKTGRVDEKKFSQANIAEIQYAKAAIRAGIEILLEESKLYCENIQRVFLAGGFGYKMNTQNAAAIGLIPAPLTGRIHAAGNAALGGCAKFLREPHGVPQIVERVHEINLSEHAKFEQYFITHMTRI